MIWVRSTLLFYNQWADLGLPLLTLGGVALTHTAAAFAMLIFVIAHVYMATMGKTVFSMIKPMITGYEDEQHDTAAKNK